MGLSFISRARFQRSACNCGGISVWGIGRVLLRAGCGHRTRTLARSTWREDYGRPDLIYGRWTTGHCRGGWTRAIRVWPLGLLIIEPEYLLLFVKIRVCY